MRRASDYHQQTKHSFNRFARSLGYLDWAAQPHPFRRYDGAPTIDLPRTALRGDIPYTALFDASAPAAPIDLASVGEFLRCSMGLSAWKQHQASRWALRVNPSSGNLHPTEAYVVWDGRVCHYAPREHVLEERADLKVGPDEGVLVGLTSILWREAWKYGERAFRYCQHDVGHAIGALRLSAALLGWRLQLLSEWTDAEIGALLGVDRELDYARPASASAEATADKEAGHHAEREEPECLLLVSAGEKRPVDRAALVAAARAATWAGQANVLSRSHVEWPAIDAVASATRTEGPPEGGHHRT